MSLKSYTIVGNTEKKNAKPIKEAVNKLLARNVAFMEDPISKTKINLKALITAEEADTIAKSDIVLKILGYVEAASYKAPQPKMNAFVCSKSNIEKRPVNGYTYIYIYSLDNLYIYTGQTIQSVRERYRNHLSDNSGAHYANSIAYFQIKSEYANYAEGYIAERVRGICQGNIPNPVHHKSDVPQDVRRTLQLIGNKLVNRRDNETLKAGDLPLFSFVIDNDGSKKETLEFFSMLLKEGCITNHYYKGVNNLTYSQSELYVKEMHYTNDVKAYFISRPKSDYRPMLLMLADTVEKMRFVKNIASNFPVYCVVNCEFYNRYKDKIKDLFRHNQVGLIVQYFDRLEVVYAFHKAFRAIYKAKRKFDSDRYAISTNKQFIQYCTVSNYKAKFTPYHYYQCA